MWLALFTEDISSGLVNENSVIQSYSFIVSHAAVVGRRLTVSLFRSDECNIAWNHFRAYCAANGVLCVGQIVGFFVNMMFVRLFV